MMKLKIPHGESLTSLQLENNRVKHTNKILRGKINSFNELSWLSRVLFTLAGNKLKIL